MMFPVVGAKEHLNESMFFNGAGGKDCILHDEIEMQMSFMSIIIKIWKFRGECELDWLIKL